MDTGCSENTLQHTAGLWLASIPNTSDSLNAHMEDISDTLNKSVQETVLGGCHNVSES